MAITYELAAAFGVNFPRRVRTDFHRLERLVVVVGASGFGMLLGFTAAMMSGRYDMWLAFFVSLPILGAFALPCLSHDGGRLGAKCARLRDRGRRAWRSPPGLAIV